MCFKVPEVKAVVFSVLKRKCKSIDRRTKRKILYPAMTGVGHGNFYFLVYFSCKITEKYFRSIAYSSNIGSTMTPDNIIYITAVFLSVLNNRPRLNVKNMVIYSDVLAAGAPCKFMLIVDGHEFLQRAES